MTTENSVDLVNAMMEQKDDILTAIINSESADDLAAAERMIRFIANAWHAVGYGYKLEELRGRVRLTAARKMAEERAFLAAERKNSRARNSTEIEIKKLAALANI